MKVIEKKAAPYPVVGRKNTMADSAALRDLKTRLLPSLGIGVAALTLLLGLLSLIQNSYEKYPIPMLVCSCVLLQSMFLDIYRQRRTWDMHVGVLSVVALLSIILLRYLPEYVTGFQINAIIHRSIFSAICLLIVGLGTMGVSIYYLMGATPTAEDLSKYPLILLPVVIILGCYVVFIFQLITAGAANLSWDIVSKAYYNIRWPYKVLIAGDWPKWTAEIRTQVGMLNHILGTGLLMLITTLISMPMGIGAGVFFSEYGNDSRFSKVARFFIFSLRSISILVLGLSAFSLIQFTKNTPLHMIFQGSYFSGFETIYAGGSYITAGLILSLLVVPIITRATEEGCRSLPLELREGSVALGAPEETTLFRIVIPWALPNIVTSVLLGCAEAAGSVAVLMFIAGRGEYGVGLFQQVTSLDFLIYDVFYGDKIFKGAMLPYQYSAGVLLLAITMTLGILAIVLKRWLTKRHRGG